MVKEERPEEHDIHTPFIMSTDFMPHPYNMGGAWQLLLLDRMEQELIHNPLKKWLRRWGCTCLISRYKKEVGAMVVRVEDKKMAEGIKLLGL